MAHAVAPHLLHGDFHAALFADDALVLHALVLAAQALVVLHRTEDAGAKQPVALRLEGAVVDRLRLLDFAVAPTQNLVGAGQRNANPIESRNLFSGLEDVHQLLVHLRSSSWPAEPAIHFDFVRRGGPHFARPTGVIRSPAPH